LQLLLEPLDQLAAAELQQVVVRLAALEGLLVDQPLEVDQEDVALGSRALDRLQPGETAANSLDLALDHLLGRLRLVAADLESAVLTELRAGPHPDLEFEGERLALALGRGDDLDIGVADRTEASVEQRLFVPLWQRLPHRLLEDRREPDPLDHQRRRRFPLAEAGQPHLARECARRALDPAADILGRDLDLDLGA
jgi:hypothetical protein